MQKSILMNAGIFGLLAVVLGAFGAHVLKPLLSSDMLAAYETGVRYQFYHVIALLVLGFAAQASDKLVQRAATFFMLGIILFSGSLYGLALSSISGNVWSWLGPVTPLGGLCFMTGWVFIFLFAIKKSKNV